VGADPWLLLVLRWRERGWDASDVTEADQNAMTSLGLPLFVLLVEGDVTLEITLT
jgi:hypothetical protein